MGRRPGTCCRVPCSVSSPFHSCAAAVHRSSIERLPRVVVVGDRPTASKAARVFGVVRLSRGAMRHRGQACWHVLSSAMQREQPISLVRSLSASIEHRVGAGSRGRHRRQRPTASKAARVFGVVRLSRGAMTHRGQAPCHVLPSAMQREQPISLVRNLTSPSTWAAGRRASFSPGRATRSTLSTSRCQEGSPPAWT